MVVDMLKLCKHNFTLKSLTMLNLYNLLDKAVRICSYLTTLASIEQMTPDIDLLFHQVQQFVRYTTHELHQTLDHIAFY